MSAPLEPRRLEELTLNSSAPPGQLLYDGWLLRLAPGKAKRARSVNAVYPSRLPLAQKIAHCERLYAARGLPAIFRITPFSDPAGLDGALEARGYGRFETTAVESAPIEVPAGAAAEAQPIGLAEFAEAVGELRGSPAEHRAAHRARLEGMALAARAVRIRAEAGTLAVGLTLVEGEYAGLFDIVTHEGARRRGLARRVVVALLAHARELGAHTAYLQVSEANEPARRLYRQLGFEERYHYWYRGRPGEQR